MRAPIFLASQLVLANREIGSWRRFFRYSMNNVVETLEILAVRVPKTLSNSYCEWFVLWGANTFEDRSEIR